jgi:spermidine synthase
VTMQYLEIPCINRPPLKVKIKGLLYKGRSKYQDIEVYDTEEFGRCLFIDGTIQCSEKDHHIYDKNILKRLRKDDKNILILGGGDGFIAEMAVKLNPNVTITIVDLDEDVVKVCSNYMGQHIFDDQRVKLIVDDAFIYMDKIKDPFYNGIVCDLTDFPVGYTQKKIIDFYEKVFKLSNKILKNNGWISAYGGIKEMAIDGYPVADILKKILIKYFQNIEMLVSFIPSFGEDCCLLYGDKRD